MPELVEVFNLVTVVIFYSFCQTRVMHDSRRDLFSPLVKDIHGFLASTWGSCRAAKLTIQVLFFLVRVVNVPVALRSRLLRPIALWILPEMTSGLCFRILRLF